MANVNELRVVQHAPEPEATRTSSAPQLAYVQFLVDGDDLRTLVGGARPVQEVGPPPDVALFPSRHLLGEPDDQLAADGDPFLLVCQIDADPLCGGVIARVEVGADAVTWSGFSRVWFDYEANAWVREGLAAGPFVFSARDYVTALSPT